MSERDAHLEDIPPAALARFRAAEDRLYPLAVVDVESYRCAVDVCSGLLDDLRSTCADIEAVLGRREALIGLLAGDARQGGLSPGGLPPETLVDAASAIRCRELRLEQASARQSARIARAREVGQDWLVDEPDPASVMAGFYRRVELHVPTGTVLVSSAEVDSTGAATEYVLEVLPAQGSVDEGLRKRSQTFENRATWIRAAERCRSDISTRS